MGLDMYLYATKNVWKKEYMPDSDGTMTYKINDNYLDINKHFGSMPTPEFGNIEISKCVGYWRKANSIHGWIVRNLANGNDNCQKIPMTIEDLKLLRDSCLKELNNRSKALPYVETTLRIDEQDGVDIPKVIMDTMSAESNKITRTITSTADPLELTPTEGYFFGSIEKDEGYYQDMENTIDIINSILSSAVGSDEYSFHYQASW